MKVDDYILEKYIGEGIFWKIYFTTKKDEQKKYSTNVYDRKYIDENYEFKKSLENEIRMYKNLNHPNIMKFHDKKKSKNHYFTIFEYCNGGRLSEALEKYIEKYGKPFPEEIIQHLMRQMIDAFQYISIEGIIHRLAYQDNILLKYENEEDAKNLNLIKAKIKVNNFLLSENLK